MKKNRMMRIAAVMMVLALVTTCVISGTFAKYVTSGTAASDSARVAKWGVTVGAASSLEVFKTEYAADDTTGLGVSASTNVLAPGTKNDDAAMITLSGTPEVAIRVDFAGEVTLTGWEVDGAFYCPLIIKVGADEVNGSNFTSATNFKAAVDALLNTTAGDYAPGYDLSGLNAGKNVSWEWPFEVNNTKDTALGNLATAPTISISLNATVTQID